MEIVKGKVNWIDILRPTEKDFTWLEEHFHFHPVILDELRGPSVRAKVEAHRDYLYLIYYFPLYDSKEKVSQRSEIDFLITKKEVITVSYEKVEVFDDLKRSLNPRSRVFEDTLRLTHKLLELLLGFEQRQLVHIREKIESVSAELFKDRERERERGLLEKISYLKRDISQYRLIVRPQRYIFESLLHRSQFFGPDSHIYVNDLIGEHLKVLDQLEDYRQAVEDFEITNNQLINIKNAEVVKTFTILAFLTFPMMLFAALFSMNTRDTPIVEFPYSFWIILGIMALAMTGMYRFFKRKDWL